MKFKIWLSNIFSHATSQNGEIDNFNLESFLTILENSCTSCGVESASKALKDLLICNCVYNS